jgi:iron only hydrogenase large subunit-like protein/nitrogen-specific signal transduction histidine kinase
LAKKTKIVYTIKERCRVCYTCVRECPAKAIKIINGQAEVIDERCILCGNCVKVCSQDAKVFRIDTDRVSKLLDEHQEVIAMVAPSFPAEFENLDYEVLVGMIRRLGFTKVVEVSFGADLVAKEYKKFMQNNESKAKISSDCPAIVSFIEYYHPKLVPYLAPIVSPMVAMERLLRKKHGEEIKVVFIGPCIAKKDESAEIDTAITFRELRQLFERNGIRSEDTTPSDFDPPHSGKGAVFPISRGLLQTMEIQEDILEGNLIIAEGRIAFQEAIKEFENGHINDHHLELLCCEGCILGPGMSPYPYFASTAKRYAKRSKVSKYATAKLERLDKEQWKRDIEEYSKLDLSRTFSPSDRNMHRPSLKEIEPVLQRMGKFSPKDYLDCAACGYESCVDHAVAIINGLAENEMCLPYTIEKLHNYIRELNISNDKLANVQEALKQSEKLASLGQLSAGIAHELNNPLGVITMYSNILKDELEQNNEDIKNDLELIVEQADRCKKIVGGLLNFARKNQVNFNELDLNTLIKNSVSSVVVPSNVIVEINFLKEDSIAMADRDQLTQVFSNLIKNAIDAMPDGGSINIEMKPNGNDVIIEVSDTGHGIEKENIGKLFTPFFTTKPIGKGTGLGLSIIYGIVKMHKGDVTVNSNADPATGPTGTTFKIRLPRHRIE